MHPQVELRNRARTQRPADWPRRALRCPAVPADEDLPPRRPEFEAGRTVHSREEVGWFGGVVVGRNWNGAVESMAELCGEWADSLDDSVLRVNLGMRLAVVGGGSLLLSLGRDLHNELEEPASVFGCRLANAFLTEEGFMKIVNTGARLHFVGQRWVPHTSSTRSGCVKTLLPSVSRSADRPQAGGRGDRAARCK